MKSLPPSTEFLFSNKVVGVSKVLQESMAMNPLAMKLYQQPGRGGFKRSFKAKFNGGSFPKKARGGQPVEAEATEAEATGAEERDSRSFKS